jgi:hypothetical protein
VTDPLKQLDEDVSTVRTVSSVEYKELMRRVRASCKLVRKLAALDPAGPEAVDSLISDHIKEAKELYPNVSQAAADASQSQCSVSPEQPQPS